MAVKISIIGAGNMATGIGTRFSLAGHEVTIFDRTEKKAVELADKLGNNIKGKVLSDDVDGDVVIFTLPYPAISEVVEKYKKSLAGKILVDISNPVDFQTFSLLPPPGSSGAEEIAKNLPKGAKILKAFNTVFAGTLIEGKIGGQKLDVFIAGDDEEAKTIFAKLVENGGMRALDAGPLSSARYLEGMQLLHMIMQSKLSNAWMTGIKILP